MLEVDDDSHEDREISCELAKLDETRHAAEKGFKPSVTIRFNPDAYDQRRVSLSDRCDRLVETISTYLRCDIRDLARCKCDLHVLSF